MIDTTGLPEPLVEAIEAMIRTYRERSQVATTNGRREPGWAKGLLPELPDSFFEELPPDVIRQFEGSAD